MEDDPLEKLREGSVAMMGVVGHLINTKNVHLLIALDALDEFELTNLYGGLYALCCELPELKRLDMSAETILQAIEAWKARGEI